MAKKQGRPPKIDISTETCHMSNDEFAKRQAYTPESDPLKEEVPQELVINEDGEDDTYAITYWHELLKKIQQVKGSFVTEADRPIMVLACRAYALHRRAYVRFNRATRDRGAEAGYIKIVNGKDRDGFDTFSLKPNPDVKLLSDQSKVLLDCLSELGLTPIARAKQGIAAAKKRDAELESFANLVAQYSKPEE
jgi:phage terminase small subunit